MDEVVYVCCSSHIVSHLFHLYLHLIYLSLQMWYPLGNGTSGLIFSFNATLCPSFFWVLLKFLPFCTLVLTVLLFVDFSSQVLVLLG